MLVCERERNKVCGSKIGRESKIERLTERESIIIREGKMRMGVRACVCVTW